VSGWKGFLPSHDTLRTMPISDLDQVVGSTVDNIHTLAHGISAIGNLLACAASNEETGLNAEAVANVGFMLESLGVLISNLVTVDENAKQYRKDRRAAQ
jgi:hypothetical protein